MSNYKNDPMKHLVYKHDVIVALNMNINEPIDFVEALKNVPVVDAVEVRHGHWIREIAECDNLAKCSECGIWVIGKPNYCPNCGVKMDEEQER